jgi:hypothetical protein
MRVFDKVWSQSTDVDQAAALGPQVHKHTEVSNADNQSLQHRAALQCIEFRNLAQQRNGILEIPAIGKCKLQAVRNSLHLFSADLPASR